MSLRAKLFSFRGRLRRRDYWLLMLAMNLPWFGLYLLACREMGLDPTELDADANVKLLVVIGLPILWSNLAVAVKRLHDRDMSGWWYLLTFVPIIGGLWGFIVMALLDGTRGPNRYGPSPKYDGEMQSIFT